MKVSLDRAIKKPNRHINTQKVNWKKVDISAYKLNPNELLSDFEITLSSISGPDNSVVKLIYIFKQAAELAGPTKVKCMRKPKLVVWSPVIQQAIAEKKAAFAKWKYGGQSNDPKNPLLTAKRETRQSLGRVCRNQVATNNREERQEILDAKAGNMQLFHRLIRKQRGNLSGCVDELHVSDAVYKADNVLSGWFEHFQALSSESIDPSFDQDNHRLVLQEVTEIDDICRAQGCLTAPVTVTEVEKAVKSLNRGVVSCIITVEPVNVFMALG